MNKILTLLLTFFVLFSACKKDDDTSTPAVNVTGTNVLLIIADDMGVDAAPGYNVGAVQPNMPNLQSLAANGLTFDNAWANPVCAPTRATILTGRYGYRTGVLDVANTSNIPVTEKTIQAYLDENTNSAYSHAVIGKWHLSQEENVPTQMGIGYYAGILGGGVGDYNNWGLTENEQTTIVNDYCTEKITDLAIDWIDDQSKPWFCWVAYNSPHSPFHLPPAGTHNQGNLPSDTASINANPTPYFMAMMENLDFEIGRLLDNIPTAELDNTTIIFIGDNGTDRNVIQAPYESSKGKGSLYQGGIHVPLIVSGKDVSRTGARDASLVASVDIFATVAEITGIELPVYEDSRSFKSLFANPNTGLRTYNYSETFNMQPNRSGYTIRDAQYKLIQFDSGTQRFFDLSADSYETTNLGPATLNTTQAAAKQALVDEAGRIRE